MLFGAEKKLDFAVCVKQLEILVDKNLTNSMASYKYLDPILTLSTHSDKRFKKAPKKLQAE